MAGITRIEAAFIATAADSDLPGTRPGRRAAQRRRAGRREGLTEAIPPSESGTNGTRSGRAAGIDAPLDRISAPSSCSRAPCHGHRTPRSGSRRRLRPSDVPIQPAGAAPAPGSTAPVGGPPVLECSGLRKRFGERQAVDGVGFKIAPGETYGLLGPNGAGKTTTISMICGILRRDEGEVLVGGRSMDPGTHLAQGRDRLRPPGPGHLPGPERSREPRLLRAALRPRRIRPPRPGSTRSSRSST